MKRFVLATTLVLAVIILSLWADETKKIEDSGKHFGQITEIKCNARGPAGGQVAIPVQFQATATKGHRAGDIVAIDNIAGIMRYVPATGPEGFLQGSPDTEPGRKADETQFTHILTRNIAVMETEVTIGMWTALQTVQPRLGSNPTRQQNTYRGKGEYANPVQYIYWCQAAIFANWLSIENGLVPCYYTTDAPNVVNYTGSAQNIVIGRDTSSCTPIYCDFSANGYRLPTEGEWEYFTRAGTTTTFSIDEPNYNGNSTSCDKLILNQLARVARYCENYHPYTYYVGHKLPNPWNLKDVHGNVNEWCWDLYGEYPTETVTDYQGADSGTNRVIRGGGFNNKPINCRSAYRMYSTGNPGYNIGFRLVRTL